MHNRPEDKTVGSDRKVGSKSAEKGSAVAVGSLNLLQMGTIVGVVLALLVLSLVGLVVRRRGRSTRRRVVMREGVDENPLYGQLR